ncbi:MAG: alpha-glycosidase [Anaerolineae bacterium]
MPNILSHDITRRLRPDGPFHIPPGGLPIGSRVTLTLSHSELQPQIFFTNRRDQYTWQVVMSPAGKDTWQAEVQMPSEMTIVDYYFMVGERRIEERVQVEGHNRPVYGAWTNRPFKIAVYDPERMPAEWTQGMVVYQIFPDRFAKVQSDDEVKAKLRGVYGHAPLFKTWDETPEFPPLGRDFFGGDLRGVIEKLDYLQDLGVDTIYFNPIFKATANHRYEAVDFREIDPMLGTDADFDELVEGIHQRGMRLVLDAVFNHCSSDSIYFDVVNQYGNGAYANQESPYYRWFRFEEWPTKYDGWYGHGFMPEFVECPEMVEYFCGVDGVTEYWLKRGIDGWRADVAFDNTEIFWRQFRRAIDRAKPGAWSISEEWRDATHYMLGDEFNGTMNYRFAWAVFGFLATDQLTPSLLDDRLMTWMRDTPPPAIKSQMNMLDSHDTERVMAFCKGDRARYLQIFAFHLAYVGAPNIYYGSETALEGTNAEDGRRPMPWDHLDQELHAYFRHLMNYRKHSQLLRHGDVETVVADDAQRVYVFLRSMGDERLYAAFNASDAEATVQFPAEGTWQDVIGTHPAVQAENGVLTITLNPRGAAWYIPAE